MINQGVPDHERLITALRAGERLAAVEFDSHFRRDLERYARRVGVSRWEITACVTDVLSDALMRFANPSSVAPSNLPAYLRRALRNRHLNAVRDARAREGHHAEACDDFHGQRAVTTLCSEEALRSSAPPNDGTVRTRSVLERLALELDQGLTEQERDILVWIAHDVPRGEIAEWLGVNKDAITKRIWRLCIRLRAKAAKCVATYPPGDQSEFEQFRRRADAGVDAAHSRSATA